MRTGTANADGMADERIVARNVPMADEFRANDGRVGDPQRLRHPLPRTATPVMNRRRPHPEFLTGPSASRRRHRRWFMASAGAPSAGSSLRVVRSPEAPKI